MRLSSSSPAFVSIMIVCVCTVLTFHFTKSQVVPPAGFYVSLQPGFVQGLAEQLSIAIADEANDDTTTPPISGQSGSVHYTLSNFVYDIDLGSPSVTVTGANGQPAILNMTWANLDFILQVDYDVRRSPLAEHGYVQIFTAGPTVLTITATIDLSGAKVLVSNSAATLNFPQGNVLVQAQCTSTLCLIPVGDIANAAAQGFVPAFQTGVTNGFNAAVQQSINTLSLNYPIQVDLGTFGSFPLSLELQGFVQSVPTASGNVIVAGLKGAADAMSQGPQSPPFNPTISPNPALFSSPSSSMEFVGTAYSPLTVLWALSQEGFFNRLITNQEVPEMQLTTNSTLWMFLVPGLVKFPNMNIQVQTSLGSPFAMNLQTDGAHFSGVLKADFTLINSTLTVPSVWTFLVGISGTGYSTFQISGSNVVSNTSFSAWNANLTVSQSQIGSVFTFGLSGLLTQALANYVQPMIVTSPITPPSSSFPVQLNSLTSSWLQDAVTLSAGITVTSPFTEQICNTTAPEPCPDQTTCCDWSAGGWGCCTLPSASCCKDFGCCPQGWVCYQEQCYQQGTGAIRPRHKH